jgi:hypothetical protein
MSKAAGEANVAKFINYLDALRKEGLSGFKPFAIAGSLSRGRLSEASGVKLGAFKQKNGNRTILTAFDDLEEELQDKLPNLFYIIKKSALEQYNEYVEKLEQTGGKFPVDSEGDLDIIRLAKSIGIPTARLNSPAIKELLNEDRERVGTEVVKGKTLEERMEGNLISTSSELSKCRKDLAIAEEKINGLTTENLKLESANRKLQQQSTEKDDSIEYAVESGRRWHV